MKNRLLYILVSLMVISLIGIIVLQSQWISGAIDDRESEFKAHVNSALNDVNKSIDKAEAIFFIDEEFGGLDSLLHDVVVIDQVDGRTVRHNPHAISNRIHIAHDSIRTTVINDDHRVEFYSDGIDRSMEEFEVQMELFDSSMNARIVLNEAEENKLDQFTSLVKRFTFERSLSKDLKDRISMEALSKKVNKFLSNEGVNSEVEIGVYNKLNKQFESGFVTDKFDSNEHSSQFSKALFPHDHDPIKRFELNLQFNSNSDYVWSGIWGMVLLCLLFTILILLCFGYSIYFIVKQKRTAQVKSDFINNMTHELKTPLASISLAASSIAHPKVIGDQSEVQRFIGIIQDEERRINAHVERVLDVAALDKSELKMDVEEIDLLEIIQHSLRNIDLSLSASNGEVKLNCSIESAPYQGDTFHLTSVFTNILDNSIKYKNKNPQITISLVEDTHNYVIKIEDNGIGMGKKSQKLAFDQFYRAETGNIHTRKGFGLGLSYVKSIVEAHAGTVELTSELNKGTLVTITLPKK